MNYADQAAHPAWTAHLFFVYMYNRITSQIVSYTCTCVYVVSVAEQYGPRRVKPVFGVSSKVRRKAARSATEMG